LGLARHLPSHLTGYGILGDDGQISGNLSITHIFEGWQTLVDEQHHG
jgi:hypothetical protein